MYYRQNGKIIRKPQTENFEKEDKPLQNDQQLVEKYQLPLWLLILLIVLFLALGLVLIWWIWRKN